MSVGRFFLFSFSQNLNRSTSAHFHITVGYIRSGHSRMLKLCTNVSAHCVYTLLPAGAVN